MRNYEAEHNTALNDVERKIYRLYTKACKSVAVAITKAGIPVVDDGKLIDINDYPDLKATIDDIADALDKEVERYIASAITTAEQRSAAKAGTLVDEYWEGVQARLVKLDATADRRSAAKALPRRKKYSPRVWNTSPLFRSEMYTVVSTGIEKGTSAAKLASDLKKYLLHPDTLFRRVRTKGGALALSKAAAAYHPGRGVYRSAYKNARRLAVTEINAAYRAADCVRWQQMDFVVGIRITTSNNHPVPDICDDFKGDYPKTFIFTGWHPHCRCHAEPILKTPEEFLNGAPSSREVTTFPPKMEQWAIGQALNGKTPSLLANIGTSDSLSLLPIVAKAVKEGVNYEAVTMAKSMTSEEAAAYIGGKSKARGACVPSALAYIGARLGYDVEGLKGKKSQHFFSHNACDMGKALGHDYVRHKTRKSVFDAVMNGCVEGREYLVVSGGHAAIVRKEEGVLSYLELQDKPERNGFRAMFTHTMMVSRFGKGNFPHLTMIDIDEFKDRISFKILLGFINNR